MERARGGGEGGWQDLRPGRGARVAQRGGTAGSDRLGDAAAQGRLGPRAPGPATARHPARYPDPERYRRPDRHHRQERHWQRDCGGREPGQERRGRFLHGVDETEPAPYEVSGGHEAAAQRGRADQQSQCDHRRSLSCRRTQVAGWLFRMQISRMSAPSRVVRVAAVQAAPVFLDLAASLDRLEEWARRAAEQQARLIAFGETWLVGYPEWLDESPEAALWGHRGAQAVFQRLVENSVSVPGWPGVQEMHQVASRSYAFEGRCFVLAVGSILRRKDMPPELPPRGATADPDAFLIRGGSAVIAPNGRYLAGPVYDEETIVVADCDLSEITREALTLDVSGHYSRPDVFDFRVKTVDSRGKGKGEGEA